MNYSVRMTTAYRCGLIMTGLSVSAGCVSSARAPAPAAASLPAAAAKPMAAAPAITLASPFKYASVLTFSPDGTLFVADSGTGKVYSMTPPATTNPAAKAPYNLKSIDKKLAALLGTTSRNVRIRDMAVHPMTKEAYLAVGRVTGETYASAIVVVNQAGMPRLLDLSGSMKEVQLPFSPASGFAFYDEVPARDLSVTDLEYYDGRLFVAGLSNADFSSSLWTIPVPFGKDVSTTTVEIYHAVHNQQETRAPIRTMKILQLNGEAHLLAAYTCTPLVVIPLSAIKDGAHVVGKTIGEMGYGNTPGDLVAFTGQDAKQKPVEMVFLSNKNQAAQVFGVGSVAAAAKKDGLAKPVMINNRVDLGSSSVPMTGLLHIEDQDDYHLVAVRRDMAEGDIEVVSYLKNVYFRLSDFQSEYEIPGYTYPASQDMIRQFQNKMKQDEGHKKFVTEG